MWQADPAIAKRAFDDEVEAILSGDSDFPMYVGTGGPNGLGDIMLRSPKMTKRKGLQSLEIWTEQKTVADYIFSTLQAKVPSGQLIFKKDPKYPVFDGLVRLCSRTLFAIGMGCDALPNGIRGFGASKAHDIKGKIDWTQDLDAAEERNWWRSACPDFIEVYG